jgi:hypothetical protein
VRERISVRWCFAALPSIVTICLFVGSANASALGANKTTTALGGTPGHPTLMTGNITLTATTRGTTYTLVDAFQALPNGGANKDRYYRGTYVISFLNCSGGTGNNGSETIGAGGVYPGGPAPTNSAAPSLTASSTSVSCGYLIVFAGSAPAGPIVSIRNDAWVLVGGTQLTQAAGPSVTPPFDPTIVPEVGLPVLLPFAGLLLFGVVAVRRRRRLAG